MPKCVQVPLSQVKLWKASETIRQCGIMYVYMCLDNDIVITGEWCGAVLRDFNITTDPHRYGVDVVKTRRELVQFNASGQTGNSLFHYRGRGMQYHLGFHHASNFCRYVF